MAARTRRPARAAGLLAPSGGAGSVALMGTAGTHGSLPGTCWAAARPDAAEEVVMAQGKRPKIQRTTEIAAPVEKVFAYYANMENQVEIWPSLVEVRDMQYDEQGRPTTYEWTYKMAGMRFDGTGRITEYEPNRRVEGKRPKIQRTTEIAAPVEKVFAYYANMENQVEIWPSLVEVRDMQYDEQGRPTTYEWTYKMAGMRFDGTGRITEYEPNRRFAGE